MATGVDTELVEFLERLKYGEYAGCIAGILWQLACRQCDLRCFSAHDCALVALKGALVVRLGE